MPHTTTSRSLLLSIAIGAAIGIGPSSASAYRTEHGFLDAAGVASTCDSHVPVTLDVPANAQPIPDPFMGEFSHGFYHVEEIEDELYYITDGVYQMMVLVADQGLLVVDAPPSIGINNVDPGASVSLVDVIASVPGAAGKDIKRLVYSHSHLDHIGAAGLIADAFPNVKIVAHRETARQLARATGGLGPFLPGSGPFPVPEPTRTFKNITIAHVGLQFLVLKYEGPVHEPGNIFIYAPWQKVLMLVDTAFPGWSPFNNLALAEDIPKYVEAYDLILDNYDFDVFIGGHLNRLGTREDIETNKAYVEDIMFNATDALINPSLFAIFGIVFDNSLGAFNIYLDQVACDCANATLDPTVTPSGIDWVNTLGAADINTLTHCWTMAEALRIDSF